VTCPFGSKGDFFAVGNVLLEITGIRVERLQDISEDDAQAEGIKRSPHGNGDQWLDYPLGSSAAGWTDPRDSYKSLWESINGSGSWEVNPFVWVVRFKDISAIGSGEAFARGCAK
jgi:hypothetical protein